jgi:hypothetical protein
MSPYTDFAFLIQYDKPNTQYEGNRVVIQQSLAGADPWPLFMQYLASHDQNILCTHVFGCGRMVVCLLTPGLSAS